MLDELFEVFERKKHNRSDHHNRPLDVNHRAEDHIDDHHSDYREQRGYSPHSDFGHRRLTDLLHNKKIMTIGFIMIPIGIFLLVGICILLLPTLKRVGETVNASGIKGVIEAALPLLRQLWQGGNS
jgi:hypothetical protein